MPGRSFQISSLSNRPHQNGSAGAKHRGSDKKRHRRRRSSGRTIRIPDAIARAMDLWRSGRPRPPAAGPRTVVSGRSWWVAVATREWMVGQDGSAPDSTPPRRTRKGRVHESTGLSRHARIRKRRALPPSLWVPRRDELQGHRGQGRPHRHRYLVTGGCVPDRSAAHQASSPVPCSRGVSGMFMRPKTDLRLRACLERNGVLQGVDCGLPRKG